MCEVTMMTTKEALALKSHKVAWAFRSLDPQERENLKTSISRLGFDPARPLVVGKVPRRARVLVEGIQRRDVASELGLKEMPVIVREFANDEEVQMYIFSANIARRHDPDEAALWTAARAVALGLTVARSAEELGTSDQRAGEKLEQARTDSETAADIATKASALRGKDVSPEEVAGVQVPGSGKVDTRTGKDEKQYPNKRKPKAEQLVWDEEAAYLAGTIGTRKAAEELGCSPQSVSNAVKRMAKRADERATKKDAPPASNTDPVTLEVLAAWTNFKRIPDPAERFRQTLLAGNRIKTTTSVLAEILGDTPLEDE